MTSDGRPVHRRRRPVPQPGRAARAIGPPGLMDDLTTAQASRQLFAASGCGIMMVDDTSALCAVAATDEPGRLLEVYQEETGHGPVSTH